MHIDSSPSHSDCLLARPLFSPCRNSVARDGFIVLVGVVVVERLLVIDDLF